MERIGLVTAETMESVADLWRAKASASSVEEQQQTFMEFQRNLNDAVASLRRRLGFVVQTMLRSRCVFLRERAPLSFRSYFTLLQRVSFLSVSPSWILVHMCSCKLLRSAFSEQ